MNTLYVLCSFLGEDDIFLIILFIPVRKRSFPALEDLEDLEGAFLRKYTPEISICMHCSIEACFEF